MSRRLGWIMFGICASGVVTVLLWQRYQDTRLLFQKPKDLEVATNPKDLPLKNGPDAWAIDGLVAQVGQEAPVVSGQPVLELTAAHVAGYHRIGTVIKDLPKDTPVLAAAWVQTNPNAIIIMDVRDGAKQSVARQIPFVIGQSAEGEAAVDPTVAESTAGSWTKLSVRLDTPSGICVVYVGLNPEQRDQFIFGGFDVSPAH